MRETRYVLIDDIDGSEAEETAIFAVGRQFYEIELSADHLKQFHSDMEKWTAHARKTKAAPAKNTSSPRTSGSSEAAQIREWARKKGIKLSDRGRVPATIRDQYYAERSA